ncbi:CLUMA_CG014319, isoform A [Clunio marinus]|uniref:CLUMA_CG014319, isoform A n=1 Tax=Clunio marinus TaxID=568069 RepID=A0A1J1IM80_9DIPT|nr:CLUMA_CG014319, isoform A [Clunio marinus]
MNRKVILLIFFCFHSSTAGLNKCCPENEVVQIDSIEDNNLSPRERFSCVKKPSKLNNVKRKRESENYEINNITIPINLIAYNILIDENTHWPACEVSSFMILTGSMEVSQSKSCVDIMDSDYYVFFCDEMIETDENDSLNVFKLQKCCQKDFSYDVFARKCVINNETTLNEEFNTFLHNKTIMFDSGIPECKPDDVLVEYHSNVHLLKMYENSLIVMKTAESGPEKFNDKSFCVESTLNSEHEIADSSIQSQLKMSSKWIAKVCRPANVICKKMPCVRKCCKEGQRMVYENETFCEDHNSHLDMKFHSFNFESSPEEPNEVEPSGKVLIKVIWKNRNLQYGKYFETKPDLFKVYNNTPGIIAPEYGILMPKHCDKFMLDREEDAHYISGIDGSLFISTMEKFHSNNDYCVDFFYTKDEIDPEVDVIQGVTFVCFDEDETRMIRLRFQIYATLLAISAGFLGITFIVYIFLPKLLNLHGKTLVCHVLSLFTAYSFLSAVQFATDVKMTYCKCIGYIVYFSFLSALLDSLVAFIKSIRMSHGIRRTKEVKRFFCYSLYAWGFPCLVTIHTYMLDSHNVLPEKFKPNIGESSCWFENSSPGHLIFFLVPIGIQISINFVLFIITAIHCNRVKAEIHRMQMNDNNEQKKKRYIADKAIFLMNLKLFIVMGISWLLEIMATVYDNKPWWYVSDGFNLLQGVLVFFIFVFKRKVLVAFQKKLGIRSIGFRPKTPGSTSTHMSTVELHSTALSKYNGKMLKSNSSSTLTNTTVNLIKN